MAVCVVYLLMKRSPKRIIYNNNKKYVIYRLDHLETEIKTTIMVSIVQSQLIA